MSTKNRVHIYGAGLSGLVSAINLAKAGHKVVVFDREKQIGGSGKLHPSVHLTPIDLQSTWEYIGLDLSKYFTPLNRFTVYIGDKTFELDPTPLYLMERGSRETSLDMFLFKEAQKLGVEFEFLHPLTKEDISKLPKWTIIATGMHYEILMALKLSHTTAQCYISTAETDKKDICFGYWNEYTPDYGYVAITNGLLMALVFSRTSLTEEHRDLFNEQIIKTEGVNVKNWRFAEGTAPLVDNLFIGDNIILAGNISGMVEPVFSFGIVGAMYSGKIAAIAVDEPEKAKQEFKMLTKTHPILHKIPPLIKYIPWPVREPILSATLTAPSAFAPLLNIIARAIPGYIGPSFVRKKRELTK
jgi:flavin-dependent dehydrogenase